MFLILVSVNKIVLKDFNISLKSLLQEDEHKLTHDSTIVLKDWEEVIVFSFLLISKETFESKLKSEKREVLGSIVMVFKDEEKEEKAKVRGKNDQVC